MQVHSNSIIKKFRWNIFISNSVLECPNGINCLEKAFYQILAARYSLYRSNPTEGTERSRNEGGGRCNHKQQQHVIYRGREIQNTKLEATCVLLLVVITTVALTWSAKRATSRINSAWSCSIPQGFPQPCCSIANNYCSIPHSLVDETVKPTPLTDSHLDSHIVSSIISCGVDSLWLVGEIVNIDWGHNTTSVWLMFRDPCYEAFAWVTPLKRLCCR